MDQSQFFTYECDSRFSDFAITISTLTSVRPFVHVCVRVLVIFHCFIVFIVPNAKSDHCHGYVVYTYHLNISLQDRGGRVVVVEFDLGLNIESMSRAGAWWE